MKNENKASDASKAASGRKRLDVADLETELRAGRVTRQVFDDGSAIDTLRGEVVKVHEAGTF